MPAAQAKDLESILGLCCAWSAPDDVAVTLSQPGITVSNREFYENKLFIVPSPHLVVAGLGLAFHFVEGGTYDRGQSGTNRVEARVVCRAILDHAADLVPSDAFVTRPHTGAISSPAIERQDMHAAHLSLLATSLRCSQP
jgi:hypothetical protein